MGSERGGKLSVGQSTQSPKIGKPANRWWHEVAILTLSRGSGLGEQSELEDRETGGL